MLLFVLSFQLNDVTLYCVFTAVKGTQVNIVVFLFVCFCEEKINVDHDMKLPKERNNRFI